MTAVSSRETRPGLPWWLLILLLAASLGASAWVAVQRLGVERANRRVELVLDYYETERLAEAVGRPAREVVAAFREAGVTALAVGEYTVDDYLRGGNVVAVTGREAAVDVVLGRPRSAVFEELRRRGEFHPRSVYFVTASSQAARDFDAALARRFRPAEVRRLSAAGRVVWEIAREPDWLLGQNLGLAPDQLQLAAKLGLSVAPRWSNYRDLDPEKLRALVGQLPAGAGSVAIFSGKQILGYPRLLEQTAEALEEAGLRFGFVEFANQDGEEELAKRAGYRIVRVHSITAEEMEKIKPQVAAARDLRAVRERGIRVIYLRPFRTAEQVGREEAALDFNLRYIRDLRSGLINAGFVPGRAAPLAHLPSPAWALALASLGAFTGGLLLLRRYVSVGWAAEAALAVLGTLGALAGARAGYDLLIRQVLALGAAVSFSTLGVLWGWETARAGGGRWPASRALGGLAVATACSLSGALTVVGLLGQNRFLTAVATFSGVKALHVLPLVLVWFALRRELLDPAGRPGGWRSLWDDLRRVLARPVTWEQAWLVLLGAGVVLFYLLRTGTYVNVPVASWERAAREALERWLVVRPRTKEFLVGHPALLLALWLEAQGTRPALLWPVYLAGAVGQLSLVDTFSHLHTPLSVSAVRTALGLLLGVFAGVAAGAVWLAGRRLARWWLGGRLPRAGGGEP